MRFFIISMYIAFIDLITFYAGYEIINYIVNSTNETGWYGLFIFVIGFALFNIIYLTNRLMDNKNEQH